MPPVIFVCSAVFCLLIAAANSQQCSASQFTVKNNGVDYLVINSPNEVRTCGGVNICDTISEAKQSLSLNDGLLSISASNSVQLPDKSDTNELQTLSLQGVQLAISNGNTVQLPDSDPKNELQNLTIQNRQLSISGGNSVELPAYSLNIQSGLLSISDGNSGNTVQLPDADPANEIQSLTLQSGQLSISKGNTVQLPDADSTNEIQSLSLQNGALQLSKDSATVDVQDFKRFLGISVRVPVGTSKSVGWSILPFSQVVYNTFSANSFNPSTKSFTPPLSGYYRLNLRGYLPDNPSNSNERFYLSWNVNDSTNTYGFCGGMIGCCGTAIPNCMFVMQLNASDTVRVQMYNSMQVTLGYPPDSSAITTQFEWQTEYLGPL